MSKYRRVALEDRCQIFSDLSRGFGQSCIAKKLGFHKSTISREISRNQINQDYNFLEAEKKAQRSFRSCRRSKIINKEVGKQITVWLKAGFSPEQISGRLRLERVIKVSTQTIYNYLIERPKLQVHLRKYGRRRGGGRLSQRRSRKSRQRSIHERSELVKRRVRLGDWERDGMYLSNKQQVLVLNERKSKYVKLAKMGTGKPKEVTALTNRIILKVPIRSYTMTNDNGQEFRDSKNVEIKTYHCDIGKPQQRGTVENTIGLLREYLPRKMDADRLGDRELRAIEKKLNMRPRKILDYKTPYEVLFKTRVALAT